MGKARWEEKSKKGEGRGKERNPRCSFVDREPFFAARVLVRGYFGGCVIKGKVLDEGSLRLDTTGNSF